MEEKNVTKISLSTFFLILAIIAIIVMGVFIYKLNNDKTAEIQKSTELQAQVNSLNGTVSDLQGKIESISNTINTNSSSNITNSTTNNNNSSNSNTINKENTDKIAKELFEKGSRKIREAQYTDYYEYEAANPNVEKTINGRTYQKRNILYSEIEKKYSEIFTGDALKKVLNQRFAEVDGYLYVSYGGATGWDITNVSVSKISESNNEIKYTVKYSDVEIDDSISQEQSCNMTIKLVDGNYRIVSTDYCNL